MVTVRFFASLREAVGADSLEIETANALTVEGLLNRLCEDYPALAPFRQSVRGAVNERYAEGNHPVGDGDEVAFFPPVSGGRR